MRSRAADRCCVPDPTRTTPSVGREAMADSHSRGFACRSWVTVSTSQRAQPVGLLLGAAQELARPGGVELGDHEVDQTHFAVALTWPFAGSLLASSAACTRLPGLRAHGVTAVEHACSRLARIPPPPVRPPRWSPGRRGWLRPASARHLIMRRFDLSKLSNTVAPAGPVSSRARLNCENSDVFAGWRRLGGQWRRVMHDPEFRNSAETI